MTRRRVRGDRGAQVALLGLLVAAAVSAHARGASAYPRWFLEAGAPCGTCHVSPQGGGVRNEIGWYQETHASLAPLGDKLPKSQSFLGGKVWAGGDFRFQMARLGAPRPDGAGGVVEPDRRFIPMQMSLYAAAKPIDSVYITAALHIVDLVKEVDTKNNTFSRFPGMAPAEGAIQWSPSAALPTVRAGLIQPSLGIRHEDHTMFIRSNPANPRQPFIPPLYAEPGVEASYHPISWFQAELGIFSNTFLREAVTETTGSVSWLARVLFLPQFAGLNTWIGASAYGSGSFFMVNGFAAIGFPKGVSLMVDASQTGYGADRSTFTLSGVLGWSIRPWVHVYGRGEYSSAVAGASRPQNDQYVFGATFNPIPFLEIRPEYRYLRTNNYVLAQYALQLYAYF